MSHAGSHAFQRIHGQDPKNSCVARKMVHYLRMQNVVVDTQLLHVRVVGNVLHVHVRRHIDEHHLEKLDAAIGTAVAANPQGVAILVTMSDGLEEGRTLPEVRAKAVSMFQKYDKNLHAIALVPSGRGLGTTILRTVVNTMFLASRLKHAKVHTDLASAAHWIVPLVTAAGTPLTIGQLIEDAKAAKGLVKSSPMVPHDAAHLSP